MFFKDAYIRSELLYKNSTFCQKNDILKIKFDNHQMHIKNQTIEDRRIYMRIMFRLKEMFRDVCDYCKTL